MGVKSCKNERCDDVWLSLASGLLLCTMGAKPKDNAVPAFVRVYFDFTFCYYFFVLCVLFLHMHKCVSFSFSFFLLQMTPVCLDVEGVGFCSSDGIDSSLFVAVDGMVLMSVACVDGNGFLRL